MASLVKLIMPSLFLAIMLMDIATVQGRMCVPGCGPDERCISVNPRERRSRFGGSVCVPMRCMVRARRGRCRHFTPHFAFDRATLSCKPLVTGACYGRSNRFRSRESCELTCSPWLR